MATTPAKKDQPELTKFQKFVKFAQDRAALETSIDDTAAELAEKQVIKIVDSTNVDELFSAMELEGLTGFKFLAHGTELQILEYRLVRSHREDINSRTSVYAIVNAVNLHTGETMALDTDVERIIAFLLRCDQLEAFPVEVQVVKKTTQSGREMISLAKPPVRVAAKHAASA